MSDQCMVPEDPAFYREAVRDARRAERVPFPEIHDDTRRQAWRERAARDGTLAAMREALENDPPLEILPFAAARDFSVNGDRIRYETHWRGWMARFDRVEAAAWLGVDVGERLDNMAWALCEASDWRLPAHRWNCPYVDLDVAMVGYRMGLWLTLFGDRLDGAVRRRLLAELDRRVWDPAANKEHLWHRNISNWNAVCHAGTTLSAIMACPDDALTATLLRRAVVDARHFLTGFADDGGCTEGAGYWEFGFGWFLRMAAGFHAFTDGAVDLFALYPKARAVLRYPRVGCLGNGLNVPISDCPTTWYLPPALAEFANRFGDVPELFGMARLDADGGVVSRTLETLLFTDADARHTPYRVAADEVFPVLGQAVATRNGLTLTAKAGHNAEIHNHNDVGSFVVLRGQTFFLTDPGGPRYRADTFGPHRYDILFCGSQGHGVPVVDGQTQRDGRAHEGTLTVAPSAPDGDAVMRVEFARAYAVEALNRLERALTLHADGRGVDIEDRFVFEENAHLPVREVFVTWLDARLDEDGRAVRLPSANGEDGVMTLRAHTPGRFEVEALADDCRRDGRDDNILRHIAFTPATPPDGDAPLSFSLTLDG